MPRHSFHVGVFYFMEVLTPYDDTLDLWGCVGKLSKQIKELTEKIKVLEERLELVEQDIIDFNGDTNLITIKNKQDGTK